MTAHRYRDKLKAPIPSPAAGKQRLKIGLLPLLVTLLILASTPSSAATEYYFKFTVDSREQIASLTRIVSIDNVRGDTVYAYANEQEMSAFQKLNLAYTLLPHPGKLLVPRMTALPAEMLDWDSYPTYTAYVDMMNQFAASYPNLCTIYDAGLSLQGRQILFARISDNVGAEEDEPEVMYTSSIHGDELTGYVLMLRLIDYLLSNYGADSLVTRLVDSCDIWINPLANPDGTYAGGNNSVYAATRGNANGVDLNRNYPDPENGDHPDGRVWQPETIVMMNLAGARNFVISANFHGGIEVVNYPWDTWPRWHPDNDWYVYVCRQYAETAQAYSPVGYMNDLVDGITNGYAWYEVNGGRQDFMNWWHHCREVTIEISGTKLLNPALLPAHWDYNQVAFLDWLENSLYGIRGIVTDISTGLPLDAKVRILSHDFDSSEVRTDPAVGNYHRMIFPGTYEIEFSADGYFPDTVHSVTVAPYSATRVDIALEPLYLCGDANSNGLVNILDVAYLLQYLYRGGLPPEPFAAGDADGNGKIGILDATYIIGYLYKQGPAPVCR